MKNKIICDLSSLFDESINDVDTKGRVPEVIVNLNGGYQFVINRGFYIGICSNEIASEINITRMPSGADFIIEDFAWIIGTEKRSEFHEKNSGYLRYYTIMIPYGNTYAITRRKRIIVDLGFNKGEGK